MGDVVVSGVEDELSDQPNLFLRSLRSEVWTHLTLSTSYLHTIYTLSTLSIQVFHAAAQRAKLQLRTFHAAEEVQGTVHQ